MTSGLILIAQSPESLMASFIIQLLETKDKMVQPMVAVSCSALSKVGGAQNSGTSSKSFANN
jgi:hypothetical protein